ncbi:lytic transglycosylase [Thalassobius vesicularis]|uniref:Lytic transglycosylase n=1 Tax=Thalassobius vesicularis TaxID=1294297 RepID=A0A4S3ME90_9RHOB|nr:lytic transglycosylase [Thalassobius vesicularis]THD76596.1 lytic transglycosylase [Thalassobius vesicularis]
MSRTLRVVILFVLLAACGGGNYTPPRNLDDACSILSQRPKYARAFRATERRWGVPVHVQMATIYQESKFVGNARTPYRFVLGVIPMGRQSSAYGYAQAIDSTWDDYKDDAGGWGARRDDIRDATDFMGWYMNKTRDKNGVSLHNAQHQYLAYHEGHYGYSRGTYRRKSWLMRISGQVQRRADMYQAQLATCPRHLR